MGPAHSAQGRLRGGTDEALIVEGVEEDFTRAGEMGLLLVPLGEEDSPLSERVGRFTQTVSTLFELFSSYNADRAAAGDNLPRLDKLMQNGLGGYREPRGE